MPQDNIEIRSEEVHDILTRIPGRMIRWGSVIILIILLLLFYLSWLIKYPDLVATEITITSNIPPEKLLAKTSGKIETILVKDNQNVKKGTPLAVIENAANFRDVFLIKSILDTINLEKSRFPFHLFTSLDLGEIDEAYSLFQKECLANDLNTKLQPYKVDALAQGVENTELKERLTLLLSQKQINENELLLHQNELERYETLYKKGIVSTQEIEKQRLLFLQVQKNYKILLSNVSQIKSSLNELSRNSHATQININRENVNLESNVIQAYFRLKKQIKEWELNYVFRSSIDGKVAFLQLWVANQTVNTGENVFAIIPKIENGYVGKAKAKSMNAGKLKIGQDVYVRLDNYPDNEFGIIQGNVKSISLTPDKDGNILLDIALPKGLETSYKKKVYFQQEMRGTADIVTDDLRLVERILYQFRGVFNKR
ncbi:HlyD family secretion protein [Flavobacterium sp. 3HN19-14]|uniref:HlyD family secretion protein n=1 Tax=Flavobacterium sp. 3HN19-14 TaxID=3448133 RepID=UPI003EE04BF2